jgi:hypothetical protein
LAVAESGQAPRRTPAKPPASLLQGLGAAGKKFIRDAYDGYEFSGLEAHVLRTAALAYDDAATARERGDVKGARAATRQFLAAMQRLGLPIVERA